MGRKRQSSKKRGAVLPFNTVLRSLRKSRGLTQHELARLTHIHPRTITAMETGIIRNPSFQNLITLANFFGLSLQELIGKVESAAPESVSAGSEKGEFTTTYSSGGVYLISYTPLVAEIFCGKLALEGKKKIDGTKLGHARKIFVQGIIGKVNVTIEGKSYFLKEGLSLLFSGGLDFSFTNMVLRKSSLLFVTTPSLLQPAQSTP